MAAATLGLRRGNDPCGPVAQFLEQAGVGLAGWVHTACLNRCRQRRRHRRQLADWANLLDHAALAQSSPGYAASRRRDVRRGQVGAVGARRGRGGRGKAWKAYVPRSPDGAWARRPY